MLMLVIVTLVTSPLNPQPWLAVYNNELEQPKGNTAKFCVN